MMFAIGGEGQRSLDVLSSEFRIIGEDFRIAHSGSQPAKNIIDGDAHVADAGFSAPFSRVNGDAVAVVFHGERMPQ
mgnify:CR=1 FL=1